MILLAYYIILFYSTTGSTVSVLQYILLYIMLCSVCYAVLHYAVLYDMTQCDTILGNF